VADPIRAAVASNIAITGKQMHIVTIIDGVCDDDGYGEMAMWTETEMKIVTLKVMMMMMITMMMMIMAVDGDDDDCHYSHDYVYDNRNGHKSDRYKDKDKMLIML